MLKYIGHPLVDVGAATIAAFAGKAHPGEVTSEDLDSAADYMERHYPSPYLRGYLTCVFPNSAYVNPVSGPEKKQAFLKTHLRGYSEAESHEAGHCGLCGEPAFARGYRQHVPMLTGEGVLNFFPNGRAGLPLCSACMISIAAVPLGSLRCEGRCLLLHADANELTYRVADQHLRHNLQLLQLAGLSEADKMPDAKHPRTRLVESLRRWAQEEARQERRRERGMAVPVSLSAYHFSNSGQGPDLAIYHLPAPVLSFLVAVEAPQYRETWSNVVRAAWRLDEKDEDTATHRNYLYEDLLRLPEGWPRFVRVYLLRYPRFRSMRTEAGDPRPGYSPGQNLDLISWNLTALFLKEIASMQDYRVNAIRELGDRLADYIAERDPSFWDALHLSRTYSGLRVRLIRACQAEQKAGRAPLISFDDFITIFEEGEDLARPDWSLARDLVLIRVIERLYQRKWFAEHPEALEVEPVETDDRREPVASGD